MPIDAFYPQIDVVFITETGELYPAAGEELEVYNITQDGLVGSLFVNSEGVLEEGGFDSGVDLAAAGDIIQIASGTYPGKARFRLQATQESAYTAAENDVATLVLDNDYSAAPPESFVLLAEDRDEPNAAPIVVGTGKVGEVNLIPFQTGLAKNLRFYVAADTGDAQFIANDLSQYDFTDLSVPGSGGGITALFDFYTDATTTGTAGENLHTTTIAANTLANDGEKIMLHAAGTFAANGNDKYVGIDFGTSGLLFLTSGAINGQSFQFDGWIMRTSETAYRYSFEFTSSGVEPQTFEGEDTSFDWTADQDLSLRVRTPTQAGDLTATQFFGYKLPAAPVADITFLTSETGDQLQSETGDDLISE